MVKMKVREFFNDSENRCKFKKYLKTGKSLDILPVNTAIIAGYLDVCRAPLAGIAQRLNEVCGKKSTTVRNEFVENIFQPFICDLLNGTPCFDKWHKELCNCIANYYSERGYRDFTIGKSQKWINISLKYILLYSTEGKSLEKYMEVLHVPIDRFIAPDIADLIGFLPKYDTYKSMKTNESVIIDKNDYCWSKISDYSEYLECQKALQRKLKNYEGEGISPIQWEFYKWLDKRS